MYIVLPYGAGHPFSAMRAALRREIGEHWHFYALYQCATCGRWAVGNGTTFCSDKCRRTTRARVVRERRKVTTAKRAEVLAGLTCKACGNPLTATRKTRTYCSDRCRQWAHRHPEGSAPPG